jgi:hypothetical protein
MKLQVPQDFGAGLMFLGFGAVFSLGAAKYTIGSPAEMGPGFLPLYAGLFVSVIGAVLIGRSLVAGSERVELYLIPISILGISICIFALSFPYVGLAVSTFLLTVLSARASADFKIMTACGVGVVVSVIVLVLFIWGLGLPFNAWPFSIHL